MTTAQVERLAFRFTIIATIASVFLIAYLEG